MIFADAAHLAISAGAGRLWLTHYSPAMKNPEAYVENGRAIFPATVAGFDGLKSVL
jgi:ribonuclease Z